MKIVSKASFYLLPSKSFVLSCQVVGSATTVETENDEKKALHQIYCLIWKRARRLVPINGAPYRWLSETQQMTVSF